MVGGGGGRAIADHRNNQTSLMLHRKLTAGGAELAAEKAPINRGRDRGGGPGHTPKKVGLAKLRLLGRLKGKEAVGVDEDIMGDMAYRERKGGYVKERKGLTFFIQGPDPYWKFWSNFVIIPIFTYLSCPF